MSYLRTSNEWIIAGWLLSPLVAGALFGAALACATRWMGWPRTVISVPPISMMLGVLSYPIALTAALLAGLWLDSIWGGMIAVLVITWPIILVMGPIFIIYMVSLKRGRRILKNTSVLYISIACLASEILFLFLFFKDAE